jgi:hypothetical protein
MRRSPMEQSGSRSKSRRRWASEATWSRANLNRHTRLQECRGKSIRRRSKGVCVRIRVSENQPRSATALNGCPRFAPAYVGRKRRAKPIDRSRSQFPSVHRTDIRPQQRLENLDRGNRVVALVFQPLGLLNLTCYRCFSLRRSVQKRQSKQPVNSHR